MTFEEFFKAATGPTPYEHQRRLAGGDAGRACESQLINVPTGLGKTAAVVLAWLWNRFLNSQPLTAPKRSDGGSTINQIWPRRLVYCLPMRTLVEQTETEVRKWLLRLARRHTKPRDGSELRWLALHSPVILMGGEEIEPAKREWDLYPERPCILIGTQDMLLSRALNRGYGMSRYRWPMHFGLLNNDALWVLDETQLMGNGVATSVQLDGFRRQLWGTAEPCVTWWMTATAPQGAFTTTDRTSLRVPAPVKFPPADAPNLVRDDPRARVRLQASKQVIVLTKPPKVLAPKDGSGILDHHQPGSLTLVFLNTVDAARDWHSALEAISKQPAKGKRKAKAPQTPHVLLVHSRFRPCDRKAVLEKMQQFCEGQAGGKLRTDDPGLIVVTTQVLEAGVDISAARLWSEIAPWAAVVQRLGRLNRDGKQSDSAKAFFWDPKQLNENKAKDSPNAGRVGPYEKADVKTAEQLLRELEIRLKRSESYRDALDAIMADAPAREALRWKNSVVIRPDDLHGLFSTEPDLAGGFTNVAPFVRSEDADADVALYYRDFLRTPPETEAESDHRELVSVPSHILKLYLKEQRQRAFLWDEDAEKWQTLGNADIVPGMKLLLPVSAGGYSDQQGWTGNAADKPTPCVLGKRSPQKLFGEPDSEASWQTLPEHTSAVQAASEFLAGQLGLSGWREALITSARWHDLGKAHPRWQRAIPNLASAPLPKEVWAKFPSGQSFRPRARHEALSLLAAWAARDDNDARVTALVLFLVASHHGKVRTLLRSGGDGSDVLGWRQEDEPLAMPGLPTIAVDVTRRIIAGRGTLDWRTMEYTPIGPSWPALVDELLGPPWCDDSITYNAVPLSEPRNLGPFQLSYLEAIFRAADARASRGDFNPPHA